MASRRTGLLFLVATVVLFAARPAVAQSWFGNLFGGGAPMPHQGAPAYPGYGGGGFGSRSGYGGGGGVYAPRYDIYRELPHRHVQKRKAPHPEGDDVTVETPKSPPKSATLFVDVFGDSLGQMLADGLDDALANRADVGVVHRAKGSTGLVASDFYDWPRTIDDLLAGTSGTKSTDAVVGGASRGAGARPKPRIDVAVMMIGSNDRQAIHEDNKTLAFGTKEWTAAYTRRVMAIDEAFRSHHVPLIWVGVPITKDDGFADAMGSLNDITKEAAARTGTVYVDTWEAFSDDNGDFSSYGPDVNGQTVRLRATDGIHFTRAGARKLAHFVVAHVSRALDGKAPAPQLPTLDATDTTAGRATPAAAKPDAGPVRNLSEAPASKDGLLATLPGQDPLASSDPSSKPLQKADSILATTLVRGEAMPIPPGRADDARWPPQGVPDP